MIEILKVMFECQAEWRRSKAEEYPEDSRNLEAAIILDRLAATTKDVPPDVVAAYCELFEDLYEAEDESEMLRQVGFDSAPASAEEFPSQLYRRAYRRLNMAIQGEDHHDAGHHDQDG